MSDFINMISRGKGVSPRTVRRWCATGKLPGVYRTKGGHYRLIGPCLKQLRHADKRFRQASPEEKKIFLATLKQQIRWLKELVEVLDVSFVLNNYTSALRPQRDDVPIRQLLHPRTIEVVEHRIGALMIHAEKLRSEQIEITPKNLAASLQISVATLYGRYKAKAIRRAYKGDIPRPDGRVKFDHSGPVPAVGFDYDAVSVAT